MQSARCLTRELYRHPIDATSTGEDVKSVGRHANAIDAASDVLLPEDHTARKLASLRLVSRREERNRSGVEADEGGRILRRDHGAARFGKGHAREGQLRLEVRPLNRLKLTLTPALPPLPEDGGA